MQSDAKGATVAATGAAIQVAAADAPAPSPAYARWLADRRRDRLAVIGWRLLLVMAVLAMWEAAPRLGLVNPMLTSHPTAVWDGFVVLIDEGDLGLHVGVTVMETVISFTLSMVLGTAAALALWSWPMVQRVLDPFLVVANALPKIALVPIFYIWLGPAQSIYAVAVAVAVFITILMMYTGFVQTDPNKIKLVRTLGASRGQILRKVVLPANLATFIATLKANAGLALVGVIVGEFQSANAGLGYLIVYGSQIFRMDMVMAAIVILAVISLVIYLAIQAVETRLARGGNGH
ncbi:ABC transporter permease (plasmid) [Tistrella bauzanensis]|uniref:ABC transporter permease n=1 Tax=Tistrella arctica TaxID=3133430 RepID=A0ABU9YRN0_9PROT